MLSAIFNPNRCKCTSTSTPIASYFVLHYSNNQIHTQKNPLNLKITLKNAQKYFCHLNGNILGKKANTMHNDRLTQLYRNAVQAQIVNNKFKGYLFWCNSFREHTDVKRTGGGEKDGIYYYFRLELCFGAQKIHYFILKIVLILKINLPFFCCCFCSFCCCYCLVVLLLLLSTVVLRTVFICL